MKPWPIISCDISDDPYLKEGGNYHNMTISIENIGNGPLIIERLDIYVNNKPIIENNNEMVYSDSETEISLSDVIRNEYFSLINAPNERKGLRSLMQRNPYPVTLRTMAKDTGIPANTSKTLISFPLSEYDVNRGNYEKLYRSTKFKCEYKDIYGKVSYYLTDI